MTFTDNFNSEERLQQQLSVFHAITDGILQQDKSLHPDDLKLVVYNRMTGMGHENEVAFQFGPTSLSLARQGDNVSARLEKPAIEGDSIFVIPHLKHLICTRTEAGDVLLALRWAMSNKGRPHYQRLTVNSSTGGCVLSLDKYDIHTGRIIF